MEPRNKIGCYSCCCCWNFWVIFHLLPCIPILLKLALILDVAWCQSIIEFGSLNRAQCGDGQMGHSICIVMPLILKLKITSVFVLSVQDTVAARHFFRRVLSHLQPMKILYFNHLKCFCICKHKITICETSKIKCTFSYLMVFHSLN
jgi:hypothetical protein